MTTQTNTVFLIGSVKDAKLIHHKSDVNVWYVDYLIAIKTFKQMKIFQLHDTQTEEILGAVAVIPAHFKGGLNPTD